MRYSRRQFMGLVGLAGLSGCSRGLFAGGRFSFVAVNDLHVLDQTSTAIVDKAVAQINADPRVAFTAALGDLATDGKEAELTLVKASLSNLQQPCFAIPGNHDVSGVPAEHYQQFETAFGVKEWQEAEKGWVFIGLDSCNATSSNVTIPDERMAWLQAQLKGIAPTQPIALFAHHPFNPHTKSYRVKNADDVVALFKGHNLKLVAAGHYHGNQVEEREGILFTTTACCSSTRGNFDKTPAKGYRLFHIDGDAITSEFVEVAV